METSSHRVGSLQPEVRQVIETLVGHSLTSDQSLVIQVLGKESSQTGCVSRDSKLPAWCGVLTDITADEERALDASISARTASRNGP